MYYKNQRNTKTKKDDQQPADRLFLLAYLDSNQDKQNQNLSYYHYTIGHPTSMGVQK